MALHPRRTPSSFYNTRTHWLIRSSSYTGNSSTSCTSRIEQAGWCQHKQKRNTKESDART
jgi:hypothetical protein